MFKFISKLISLVVILAILFATKNLIAKFAVQSGVKAATGVELKIGKFDLGVTESHVGIKNLQILNPAGFEDLAMVEAPEIFVDYNINSMFKGKIHLEEARIDLDKLIIVKNSRGELNLNALKPKEKSQEAKGEQSQKKQKVKKNKGQEIQIDHLLLKVGKVVYKDYSAKGDPIIKEFDINIYETLEDIQNSKELVAVILKKALMKTTLANVANLDIDFLKDVAAQRSIDAIGGQLDSLKDKIKLPF